MSRSAVFLTLIAISALVACNAVHAEPILAFALAITHKLNASPEDDAKAVTALDTKYQAAVKANDADASLVRPKASSSRSAARESPLVLAIASWNLRALSP